MAGLALFRAAFLNNSLPNTDLPLFALPGLLNETDSYTNSSSSAGEAFPDQANAYSFSAQGLLDLPICTILYCAHPLDLLANKKHGNCI
jgi:hypothetical protein